MFFKSEKSKFYFGIFLFLFIFTIGFVKINIVYSSTGIGKAVTVSNNEIYEDKYGIHQFSNLIDDSLINIYKEDYGFDIKIKMFGNEKVYSLKLPWKK